MCSPILFAVSSRLEGDENGKAVRPQIDYLTDSEYDYTGVGLFVSFQPAEGIPRYNIVGSKRIILDGVSITSPELKIGAAAILFIKDGIIDSL